VLEGARRLLERSPGLLAVVEFRPRDDASGVAPAATLESYEQLGFQLCRLRRDGRPEGVSARQLLAGEDDVTNIVLRR
jgi:hypothetical protein